MAQVRARLNATLSLTLTYPWVAPWPPSWRRPVPSRSSAHSSEDAALPPACAGWPRSPSSFSPMLACSCHGLCRCWWRHWWCGTHGGAQCFARPSGRLRLLTAVRRRRTQVLGWYMDTEKWLKSWEQNGAFCVNKAEEVKKSLAMHTPCPRLYKNIFFL